MSKYLPAFALIAGFCALSAAASAQNMSYRFAQTAAENVAASQRYDYLLETSASFRHYHMGKECRPINDASLNADCLASFDRFEPWRGA